MRPVTLRRALRSSRQVLEGLCFRKPRAPPVRTRHKIIPYDVRVSGYTIVSMSAYTFILMDTRQVNTSNSLFYAFARNEQRILCTRQIRRGNVCLVFWCYCRFLGEPFSRQAPFKRHFTWIDGFLKLYFY